MDGRLDEVLERGKSRGFLGPIPVGDARRHAEAWAAALEPLPHRRVLDLGSGGGVPGLVLASVWPGSELVLLDAHQRRCDFLEEAARSLGYEGRVTVVCGRAEALAHEAALREQLDLVVARAFAPPAVTAECGGAFLRVGGTLSVSEPPEGGPDRWPEDGLAGFGLGPATRIGAPAGAGPGFVAIPKVAPTPAGVPRRVGVPAKRPAW